MKDDIARTGISKVLDEQLGKLHKDIKELGIVALPETRGQGKENRFLTTDLYHLALFKALQSNGMKREQIAQALRQHPLHNLSDRELSRIVYLIHARQKDGGATMTTESHEVDWFEGNNEELIGEDAPTVIFLVNFARLKRAVDRRRRDLGV